MIDNNDDQLIAKVMDSNDDQLIVKILALYTSDDPTSWERLRWMDELEFLFVHLIHTVWFEEEEWQI